MGLLHIEGAVADGNSEVHHMLAVAIAKQHICMELCTRNVAYSIQRQFSSPQHAAPHASIVASHIISID